MFFRSKDASILIAKGGDTMSLYDDPTMTPTPAAGDDMNADGGMDDMKEEVQSTEEGAETTDEVTN